MNFSYFNKIDDLIKIAAQTIKQFNDSVPIPIKELLKIIQSIYVEKINENKIVEPIDRWIVEQYTKNKHTIIPLIENKEIYPILENAKRYKSLLKKFYGSANILDYDLKDLERIVQKISTAIGFIKEYKNQLPEDKRLIQNYNSEDELDELVDIFSKQEATKDVNSEIVYEDEDWKIEIPQDHESAIILTNKARQGLFNTSLIDAEDENQSWCFGIKNKEDSKELFEYFSPIYIITYKPNQAMFATSRGSGYFNDSHDNIVNPNKWIETYKPSEKVLTLLFNATQYEVLHPNQEVLEEMKEALLFYNMQRFQKIKENSGYPAPEAYDDISTYFSEQDYSEAILVALKAHFEVFVTRLIRDSEINDLDVDVNITDENEWSLLQIAAYQGQNNALEAILNHDSFSATNEEMNYASINCLEGSANPLTFRMLINSNHVQNLDKTMDYVVAEEDMPEELAMLIIEDILETNKVNPDKVRYCIEVCKARKYDEVVNLLYSFLHNKDQQNTPNIEEVDDSEEIVEEEDIPSMTLEEYEQKKQGTIMNTLQSHLENIIKLAIDLYGPTVEMSKDPQTGTFLTLLEQAETSRKKILDIINKLLNYSSQGNLSKEDEYRLHTLLNTLGNLNASLELDPTEGIENEEELNILLGNVAREASDLLLSITCRNKFAFLNYKSLTDLLTCKSHL